METNEQKKVKARCDTIGMVMRLVFWGCALYCSALLVLGGFLMTRPAEQFTINLADDGRPGYVEWDNHFPVEVQQEDIQDWTGDLDWSVTPKQLYQHKFFYSFVLNLLMLAILWNLRGIFRRIDHTGTPFLAENCRALFRIGVFFIVTAFFRGVFRHSTTVFVFLRFSGDNQFWTFLLIGAIIIALSSIFEYGTALQKESDETL